MSATNTSAQTPAVLRHLLIGSWIFLGGCVGPERDYFDAEAAPQKVTVGDVAASTQPSHGAVPESFRHTLPPLSPVNH